MDRKDKIKLSAKVINITSPPSGTSHYLTQCNDNLGSSLDFCGQKQTSAPVRSRFSILHSMERFFLTFFTLGRLARGWRTYHTLTQ